jgi:glucokinase
MLYVTVGTGIGGGMIIDGRIDGAERPAIAEVGHLRPGIAARDAHDTVESRASGLGIETIVRRALSQQPPQLAASDWEDLTTRCQGDFSRLTTHMLSLAAADGNRFASQSLEQAAQTLGWALAQATTLLAPERIVLGGGVAMIGERYFEAVDRWRNEYGFPPLQGTCDLVPAALGEQVVVHGAVLLASTAS